MPLSESILTEIQNALTDGSFVKATLSKPASNDASQPTNIYLKAVRVNAKTTIAVTFRYKTRDEAKNLAPNDTALHIQNWLSELFCEAVIITTHQELTLRSNRKWEYRAFRKNLQQAVTVSTQANREKKRLIDPAAPWLKDLEITTAQGQVRADAQDKWRQMNKYLEVIGALLDSTPLSPKARIVDMGSGKGYLTFALAHYLQQRYAFEMEVIGVELRQPLVALCNQVVKKHKITNLQFIAKDIAEVQQERIDMLIALHACDTATDLALYAGITSKADLIVVAPCCHKQVRRDLEGTAAVQSILQHGIMKERQAEMLTDTIRSLILESVGYKTKVFEFIGVEHTPKNVMITAEQRSAKAELSAKALAEIETLKATFGLKRHHLEDMMEGKDQ
jgi:SAM-dependent methyltransferase